jgi:hypothetical protein
MVRVILPCLGIHGGLCLGVLLVSLPVSAQPPSGPGEKTLPRLSIGDPAPPIHINTWVKGTPVKELAKGKVYVIDFWAT